MGEKETHASAPSALIHLRQAEAVFASGQGVGPVTVELSPGQRLLLIGPSGSGKSTLLRMLHGAVPQVVDAVVTGHLSVLGSDPVRQPVHSFATGVGVVLQNPQDAVCLGHVEDEVALPLENLGVSPEQIPGRIGRALELAGASGLRDRQTTTLSGGELQRVGLASGIAGEPRLLLLDEPTSMLDADGVLSVRQAVDRAAGDLGAAVVLVEHRLDDLAGDEGLRALPSRWLVLNSQGQVTWQGEVAQMSWATVRELVEAGCWLPVDLELHALLAEHPGSQSVGEDLSPARDDPRVRSWLTQEPPEPRQSPQPDHTPAVLVRAQDLTIAPGGQGHGQVLTGVDLEVRAGELICVLGRNGCGKSSLLRTLAGLSQPVSGQVEAPRAGMVFQDPEHQFARSTVRAELAYGLEGESVARLESVLEDFGLQDLAERNPFRLSGGQKRLLSLLSMVVHRRRVLCADEPTFGLDRRTSAQVLRILRQEADEGAAVIVSTHDLRAAAAWADRLVVLGHGTVLRQAPPEQVLRDEVVMREAGLRPSWLVRTACPWVLRRLDDVVLGSFSDESGAAPPQRVSGARSGGRQW